MNLFDEVRTQIIACMGQDRILAGENWEDEINKLTNVELLELISKFLEDGEMKLPQLNEGETYIGLIGNAAGEAHYVILLSGDNDEANHEASLEWAKSIGGDLPNRIEQAMLWANHKDLFQKEWYWSSERYSADPAYAWSQGFGNGYQDRLPKGYELPARAVRRVPIGEAE